MARATAGLTPRLAMMLGFLAIAAAGAASLMRNAAVQCVTDGTAGSIGLRLALLHEDRRCLAGDLAVGGAAGDVMGVVVLIALPLLVAHLCGAAAGTGLLVQARTVLRGVLGALSSLVHRPEPVRVPATGARWVPVDVVRARRDDPALAILELRGPPAHPA